MKFKKFFQGRLFVMTSVLVTVLLEGTVALKTWELPPTETIWNSFDSSLDYDWMLFKKSYNRSYENTKEEVIRYIFMYLKITGYNVINFDLLLVSMHIIFFYKM